MGKESDIRNAVCESIDLINDTSIVTGAPRGKVALELLKKENISLITLRAALIVRTQELIKQNPQRKK